MTLDQELWPGWETVRLLGRGSFGSVYEIQRENMGGYTEKAAIKKLVIPQYEEETQILQEDGLDTASITAHFKSYLEDIVREYNLMASMKGHGNIVCCDDLRYIQHEDQLGWDIYIKMELLTPLAKVISRITSEQQILKIGIDICQALVFCQQKHIIHRDIKPQNIFLAENGSYKLGDFGIAKISEHTVCGTKSGTYRYMAPEVYNGLPYGSSVDIYSLGMVLYWMLNEHRLPFLPLPPYSYTVSQEENARNLRMQGIPLPQPCRGSERMKQIVLRACAFSPKLRYHSAEEMLKELQALVKDPEPAWQLTEEKPEDQTVVMPTALKIKLENTDKENPTDCLREKKMAVEKRKTEPNQREKPSPAVQKHRSTYGYLGFVLTAVAAGLLMSGIMLLPYSWLKNRQQPATSSQTVTTQAETIQPEHESPETAVQTEPEHMETTVETVSKTEPQHVEVLFSEDRILRNVDPEGKSSYCLGTDIPKNEVVSIEFLDSLEAAPEDAVDVSQNGSGGVLLWQKIRGDGLRKVYIGADGKIYFPEFSDFLFGSRCSSSGNTKYYDALESIDFSQAVNTQQVRSMSAMFQYSGTLRDLDLSCFDTSAAEDMSYMFCGCAGLKNLNVSSFSTENVTNMGTMFNGCSNLDELDVSSFNTKNVTNMVWMFGNCRDLQLLDLTSFSTENLNFNATGCMFKGCSEEFKIIAEDPKFLQRYEVFQDGLRD